MAGAPLRLCGLVGSLRRGSYNRALLDAMPDLYDGALELTVPDIGALPHYDEDLRQAGPVGEVEALAAAVTGCDAVLFVTPEYNRSIPGVLKNAIDWLSKHPDAPLAGKAAAVTGASRGALGTIMANHHLRQMLVYLDVTVVAGPEVLVGQAPTKFDEAGRLTHEPTREALAGLLTRLSDEARRRSK